jgi:hypothetical protein
LPNLNEPLDAELELQEHYHRLIPILIFLRHCFGERCWHGPESTARLIIDDPLITEMYGFLDNRVLIESMRRSNYGTTIAFIPWNYWRTSSRNSLRLLNPDSNLAICIHGCDHTNKEFEALDAALLARKAELAVQRMESQQKRTGAAFDRVMVFPQGLFSRAAIESLRGTNYLAAINTSCFPTDLGSDHLRVRDFLEPAVMRFDGFPIFQRRYPRRLFDFAFDLFLGKPALLVEHHGYFRDHCKALEEFVAQLYIQDAALTWPSLTTQLTRSCLKRKCSDGSVEVRFFTRIFQLSNQEKDSCRFFLSKAEPAAAAIENVLVDGASTPFTVEDGLLKLVVQSDPGQVRSVEILDRAPHHRRTTGFGMVHNTKVLLRRGLSEFRDNTLARHSGLLKAAKTVARKLKVTGDA